jgi:hypothetical protein
MKELEITKTVSEVSKENWQKLCKYSEIFNKMESYGDIIQEVPKDGFFPLPYIKYEKEVVDFLKCCRDMGIILSFDWEKWGDRKEYSSDDDKLMTADLETCIKLLTAYLKQEMFCEGHLLFVLKLGQIQKILERISEIVELNNCR